MKMHILLEIALVLALVIASGVATIWIISWMVLGACLDKICLRDREKAIQPTKSKTRGSDEN